MIVGNNSFLCKIGDHGEIEYAFYPHVGYELHFFDSSLAIYDKEIMWIWDKEWSVYQKYIEDTNIFKTTLENENIIFVIKDLVPISHNVLIRRVFIKNKLPYNYNFKLFFYENLRIGEHPSENTVKFLDDCIVKFNGKYTFCISSDKKINSYQCGNRYSEKSAYKDIENGLLSENPESVGVLTDSAIEWDIDLKPHGKVAFNIYIFPHIGSNIEIIKNQLNIIKNLSSEIKNISLNYWKSSFDIKGYLFNEKYLKLAKRALMILTMLSDKNGGIIASPSIHPDYRYVWGRDGSYMAVALSIYGIKNIPWRFFHFMSKVQNLDGSWLQNYYTDGKPRLTALQIDQIGSVLWAMEVYYRTTGDREFVKKFWETIEKAGNFLYNASLSLMPCFDLWEEKYGVFSYTLGAMYGGLRAGCSLAKAIEEKKEDWKKALDKLKKDVDLLYLSDEERFVKSINPLNKEIDTSILGLSYPFGLVKVNDERMIKTAEAIEKAFKYKVGGIGRYPSDVYFGGNPWIITTLWLALYYRRLFITTNDRKYLEKSKKLFNWVINHIYLFPEQIHKELAIPVSAMPLGWSCAMLLFYLYKNDDIIVIK
ncbi:oligosaccharide amylase [Methanocaldococcus villosus KIN24-T80]|uniref:Oligosaccharide amylase n=1 Tax=Methanocaldococcus villosus KIN24-T80 TaxID=1069083 RepID=N6V1D8_9EURY|nr:glycoside hydrolase family 15 protein [Methanocaldococcus villosus]ENN96073.1 oligosaccharide amylase [Methanocaldococcus villosus KIN24-T80]